MGRQKAETAAQKVARLEKELREAKTAEREEKRQQEEAHNKEIIERLEKVGLTEYPLEAWDRIIPELTRLFTASTPTVVEPTPPPLADLSEPVMQ